MLIEPSREHRTNAFLAVAGLVWVLAVGIGFRILWSYSATPGIEPSAGAPAAWPADGPLARARTGFTFVMAVHPKCPCSRASLGELGQLLARSGEGISGYALMLCPPGTPDAFARTDLWEAAARLPRVQVVLDRDGREAERFGARTSGHLVLFDPTGARRFAGGVTGARGHLGDNLGRSSVERIVAGRPAGDRQPTFGCALFDPDPARRPATAASCRPGDPDVAAGGARR
jgi:hypothetical protein